MAMRIYNNIPALTSQRYLSQTNSAISKNLERLSSGLRINHASDDASGLAISEKLRGQISGLKRASMNAQDGISLLQTAEGGLQNIQDMTQRMRELAVQAGNGIYTTNDRREIQKEVDQLKAEIDRVASSTEFNTKKLLNGDSTALWSTDKADKIDAQVMGKVAEGNYNLNIDSEPGQNYVYKTDVMALNEGAIGAEMIASTNSSNLASVADPKTIAPTVGTGYYTLNVGSSGSTSTADVSVASIYQQSGSSFSVGAMTVDTANSSGYIEIMFDETITAGDAAQDVSIKYRVINAKDGTVGDWTDMTLTSNGGADAIGITNTAAFTDTNGDSLEFAGTISLGTAGSTQKGDKILLTFTQSAAASLTDSGGGTINISGGPSGQAGPTVVYSTEDALTVADDGDTEVDYTTKVVTYASLDEDTGNLDVGSLTLNFKENTGTTGGETTGDSDIKIAVRGGGEAATSTTQLKDISRFTTDDGRNIFDNTQELTIFGNGTSATIYLEGDDTIADFEQKMQTAIVDGLGMGASSSTATEVSNVNNNLVNFVSTETANSNEAVQGTFVIQTAKLGDDSELSFIGDQALIDGLSLATIQEGENSEMTVTVTDAHTGETVGSDKVNDYMLRDVVQGVNVEIDSDVALSISWDEDDKAMSFSSGTAEDVKLHVVDNAMEMQIGANEGQSILAAIPQVDTKSLGLDDVVMVDQEMAQKSITDIDKALETISGVRATIGSQINRLEYAITGLDTTRENLTASESRIRDLDMAEEMANFTRNQILNQAGVAMLSQANSTSQLALQLLG
jgi:flagellin